MMERFERQFGVYCAKARQIWGGFRYPELRFDLTGQTAGRAFNSNNGECWVKLNKTYCLTETENMLEDTIPHEIAHILAFQRYGNKIQPHGAEWYAMFGALTGNCPKRCHDYEDAKMAEKRVNDAAKRLLDSL